MLSFKDKNIESNYDNNNNCIIIKKIIFICINKKNYKYKHLFLEWSTFMGRFNFKSNQITFMFKVIIIFYILFTI